jgi:hypothetical protein
LHQFHLPQDPWDQFHQDLWGQYILFHLLELLWGQYIPFHLLELLWGQYILFHLLELPSVQ